MRGGRCRPTRSRERHEAEPFDVKLDGDRVQILRRGRLVRTLSGGAAAELQHALAHGDDEAVQRIVGRRLCSAARDDDA